MILTSMIFMFGCTPMQITPLEVTDTNNRSEVIIHRESAFTAGGVNMIFGANSNDYVKLGNGRYASMYLRPGNHELFVRSDQGDKPYLLNIDLPANETTCLRAFIDSSSVGVAVLGGPIGFLATRGSSTFNIEKIECLSKEKLSELKAVNVTYAE